MDLLLEQSRRYEGSRVRVAKRRPSRGLAIVTCMDTRIDVFGLLGMELGEANILRNAGGRVTEDVLRSLALASHVLGVESVVLMQHTGCGLEGETDDSLQARTGASVSFLPIDDHAETLRADVELVASTSYLNRVAVVAGWLYELETGTIVEITRRDRPA